MGNRFHLDLPGLTPGADYLARLHFCETYFTIERSFVFKMTITGAEFRNLRGIRWGEHCQHPAVHGAGDRKRVVRDYVQVRSEQRAHRQH